MAGASGNSRRAVSGQGFTQEVPVRTHPRVILPAADLGCPDKESQRRPQLDAEALPGAHMAQLPRPGTLKGRG